MGLPPQFKLAMMFAKFAKDHGAKIVHSNNPDLLTKDLGNALKLQKSILADPAKGAIMTAYEVLPVILEVKILTFAVAKKLDLDTKNKPVITLLEEIVAESATRDKARYATGIAETLEWTRALFANPEIQDILKMEMQEIEKPHGIRGVGKMFMQLAERSRDEFSRLQEFLKRTKDLPPPAAGSKPAPV